MVNPGSFQGSRFQFLVSQKAAYALAVKEGYALDELARIQAKYFRRYPVDLPDNEEPAAEVLAAIDDNRADDELPAMEPGLSEADVEDEINRRVARRAKIEKRKAQIKRWMAYQYMKDRDIDPKDSGAENPYRALLSKLTGIGIKKPRAQNGADIWRKSHREQIEQRARDELKAALGRDVTPQDHKQLASVRERVKVAMYKELSDVERTEWLEQAAELNAAAMAKWKKDSSSSPSTDPVDRQRCIEGLPAVARPILDLFREATGLHFTLMAGGPEPARQGRLCVISVHSGTTKGPVPMNFGRYQRAAYKKYFVPTYGEYLRKCWTPEECRAQALESQSEGIEGMGLNPQEINLDSPDLVAGDTGLGETERVITTTFPHRETPPRDPQRNGAGPALNMTNAADVVRPTAPRRPAPMDTPPVAASTGQRPARGANSEATSAPLTTSESSAVAVAVPCPGSAPVVNAPVRPPPQLSTRQLETLSAAFTPPSPSSSVDPWDLPVQSHGSSSPVSRAPSPPPSRGPSPPPSRGPSPPPSRGPSPPPSRGPSPSLSRAPSPPHSRHQSSLAPHGPLPPRTPVNSTTPQTRKRPVAEAAVGLDEPPSKRARKPTAKASAAPIAATKKTVARSAASSARSAASSARSAASSARSAPSAMPEQALSSSLQLPPDAPKWFVNAITMLQSNKITSPQWDALVHRWYAAEISTGLKGVGVLKASQRPPAIKDWIARGRAPKWRPLITNLETYAKQHMSWWLALQPEWRVGEDGALVTDGTTGDWNTLRTFGPNGILSVIASLFFWGLRAQESGYVDHDWADAVKDCMLVFENK